MLIYYRLCCRPCVKMVANLISVSNLVLVLIIQKNFECFCTPKENAARPMITYIGWLLFYNTLSIRVIKVWSNIVIEKTFDFKSQVLNAPTLPVKEATPEDLIRSTKPVTLATAKVVAAGNSGNQEDITEAANIGRKAVTELLGTCKVRLLARNHT